MSDEAPSLSDYFTGGHRSCDARWADVEAAADAGKTEDTARAWRRFEASLRRHLAQEEEVLFPAFEQATGMTEAGPTFVMRSEHQQMRGLLDQMGAAADQGQAQELLDLGDTLLLLIQQHNQKEEHMLYPMSEQALAPRWSALREALERYPSDA